MWTPEIARTYGIRPWEMSRVTLREFEAIWKHHRDLEKAAAEHG